MVSAGLWNTSSDASTVTSVTSVTATLDASPTSSSSSERGGLGGGPCIIGERWRSGVGPTTMRGVFVAATAASLVAGSARRKTLETFFMILRGAGVFVGSFVSAARTGAGGGDAKTFGEDGLGVVTVDSS